MGAAFLGIGYRPAGTTKLALLRACSQLCVSGAQLTHLQLGRHRRWSLSFLGRHCLWLPVRSASAAAHNQSLVQAVTVVGGLRHVPRW